MKTFVIKFVFRLLTAKDFVCFGEVKVKKGEYYVKNGLARSISTGRLL